MNKTFIALIILLYSNIFSQSIEIGTNLISMSGLELQKLYTQYPEKDISSSNKLDFDFYLKYNKDISKKLHWTSGIHFGLNSFKFKLNEDTPFNHPFKHVADGAIQYYSISSGLNYKISLNERHLIYLYIGGRVSYNLKGRGNYKVFFENNGNFNDQILHTHLEYKINKKNDIILSPEVSIKYQYDFKKIPFYIQTGLNYIYSNKNYLDGTFIIYENNKIYTGAIKKKFTKNGLEVGIGYYL